jgi:hypothetical protein
MVGAAALVGALLAKLTRTDRVEAGHGPSDAVNALHLNVTNTASALTTLNAPGAGLAVVAPNNIALEGRSTASYGVYGNSVSNYAVYGASTNSVGVFGSSISGASIGVYGNSTNASGVYGISLNSIGVSAISQNSTAISASSASNNNPAMSVSQLGSGGAAQFFGAVTVNGAFTATGIKSAAVPHPDGTHRRLYCMESPESWFEDFGEARLVNGRATVTLEPEFDAVVHGDNYRVFVMPEGDCKGCYISEKRPHRFEVRELQGGTSNLTFSYRVVARRKDIAGPRLERVNLRSRPVDPPAPLQVPGEGPPPQLPRRP